MDIKPGEVMDCLRDAGVRSWCLMGLHGYVGYLPMPRATQDVDIMVPQNQKRKTIKAICARWPRLEKKEFEPVVRFYDPSERDQSGQSIPVIDVMFPWAEFQKTILSEYVVTEHETGDRYPTVEAAIVCKYAAYISPSRNPAKRKYDAGDLENLILTAQSKYDIKKIQLLADQVWAGGATEILHFIDCALNEKPFPQ